MHNYTDIKTILDFIRLALSRFNEAGLYYGHGTDNAWDEALALVLHTLHLPHDVDPRLLNANLTRDEQTRLLELIEKRVVQRVPVPYLTNEAWFAGLSFYVDERVLIPRSPMAELIENRFTPWINPEGVTHILDLCTGSGCIAALCALHFPDAQVLATDVSEEALAVAKINMLRHNLQEQVELVKSDLFKDLGERKFDIIISNPPYVSQMEMDVLPPEFKHEPTLGLAAGQEGLDVVDQILQTALDHLTPEGILVVEVGNAEQALSERYPNLPFTWLEFERGGDGVFLLTAEQLRQYL